MSRKLFTPACMLAFLGVGPVLGQVTLESRTLFRCQRIAQAQAARYAFVRQRLIGACLARVAADVVLRNSSSIDVSRAARSCIGSMYALGRGDGFSQGDQMEARIDRLCAPGNGFAQHNEDDILGGGSPSAGLNQSLEAAGLDDYCASLAEGAGTLAEWRGCLRAAAECAAHQQIASQYARALEWLNLLDSELATSTHRFAAEARTELLAIEAAIDGSSDDDSPDIVCAFQPLRCGDGILGIGENCDGSDLNGETCSSLGYPTGGSLACTADCKLDTRNCTGEAERFRDEGDQTATDPVTGLMWEAKNGVGIHDRFNTYGWSTDSSGSQDGTIYTTFLETLNNRCDDDEVTDCTANGDADCIGAPDIYASNDLCGHAGHRDWRLPTVLELKGLLLEPNPIVSCDTNPCIDPHLPGETASADHWTSTSRQDDPGRAYAVNFANGAVTDDDKTSGKAVRAVRNRF